MSRNELLLSRLKEGDESARDKLIEDNMGLVYKIAAKFQNCAYEREDLIQIGSMGLIKAARRFDMSYETQFSTYAVPVILGEIKRFLRDDGAIKVSRTLKEIAIKGRKYEEILSRELMRAPTVTEIASRCGVDEETLMEAFNAALPVDSIYKTVGDDDKMELMNVIEGERIEDAVLDKINIRTSLESLSEREREVITMRYFMGKTQTDISKIVGVTQVQVSRIEKKALLKMREALE